MGIEQRIDECSKDIEDIKLRLSRLEGKEKDQWVSVRELADIMRSTPSTIYRQISEGTIYATRRLGEKVIRIPMSQFYEAEAETEKGSHIKKKKRKRSDRDSTMSEIVFGREEVI